MLIFLGNIAFRFRRVPLRVLHKSEWIDWERQLKLALRNETIPESTELRCERIPGRPLSDILSNSKSDETGLTHELALIQLAVRALKCLHETSVQLTDGQRSAMLSHGDATISNVLYCEETQQAEWFDFDLRHDYRIAPAERHADDLRSLLFSAGYFLPEETLGLLVTTVKQEYCCESVWAALQRQLSSGWFNLDLFHLSQTRRLRASHQNAGLDASESRLNPDRFNFKNRKPESRAIKRVLKNGRHRVRSLDRHFHSARYNRNNRRPMQTPKCILLARVSSLWRAWFDTDNCESCWQAFSARQNSPSNGFSMRRTSTMTLGFVLIFLGIQFALVDSYLLTPRIVNLLSDQGQFAQVIPPTQFSQNQYQQSPYSQVGYQAPNQQPLALTTAPPAQRTITPPRWLCWPLFFFGTVVLIHGISKPRH